MQRQRVSADYLQTSAIIDAGRRGRTRPSTTRTTTRGPGTGYRLEGERWELLQRAAARARPAPASARRRGRRRRPSRRSAPPQRGGAAGRGRGRRRPGLRRRARARRSAASPHEDVLRAARAGVARGGRARRASSAIRRTSDVAFIGHDGAQLSGSGIAVGLQSKGTAVIHRADLQPLDNLELFGMAPLLTLESYRADRPQRRRLRARPAASRPCRRCSTTSPARS